MKNFFVTLFVIIIISALLLGIAYAVDLSRMASGEPVIFSTWGMDYAPVEDTPIGNGENNNNEPDIPQKKEEVEINLYFADANIMNLEREKRVFKNDENLAKNVALSVIKGPKSGNIYALIPADTEIISINVKDGLCTVDLNDEFTNFTGGTSMENLAVHSLVNSLCEIEEINKVKINVEGNTSAMFGGHYSLEDAFTKDMTIVK